MNKFVFVIPAILAFSQAYAGGGSSIGPANPASVNCVKLGGQELDSICRIGQWQLFHQMEKRGLVKGHNYGYGAMPNPAAVNCADIGGALIDDDCEVEQWALFRAIDIVTHR